MESWSGFCPICRKDTTFNAADSWYRDTLCCVTCEGGSVPRERALALVLEEAVPHWRDLAIHESSPSDQGISLKMRREAPAYIASHFRPGQMLGVTIDGFRNEDLQALTFDEEVHHLFISLDVFEHVIDPELALREIYRTLKPGGIMLSTFPFRKSQIKAIESRVEYDKDGRITHLKEPEYHGNPVDPNGSIVTNDYGYDLHLQFAEWVPFDVRIYRFADRRHGIVGEYTEVVMCKKPRFVEKQGIPFDFDPIMYKKINHDVAIAGVDPVEHYRNFGRAEGRAYKLK